MADVKFTGLAAASGIPNNGSVMAISTYDGAATYTSEKYTMTQLKDIVYVMEAEDKITFDSSGTNKVVLDDANSNFEIVSEGTYGGFFTDGNGGDFTKGWYYIDADGVQLGSGQTGGANGTSLLIFESGGNSAINFFSKNVSMWAVSNSNMGFFGATPVAKPTGVAVSAAGIHAALVSLGLIGV